MKTLSEPDRPVSGLRSRFGRALSRLRHAFTSASGSVVVFAYDSIRTCGTGILPVFRTTNYDYDPRAASRAANAISSTVNHRPPTIPGAYDYDRSRGTGILPAVRGTAYDYGKRPCVRNRTRRTPEPQAPLFASFFTAIPPCPAWNSGPAAGSNTTYDYMGTPFTGTGDSATYAYAAYAYDPARPRGTGVPPVFSMINYAYAPYNIASATINHHPSSRGHACTPAR